MTDNPFEITQEEYVTVFRALEPDITANQRTILIAHYRSPSHSATARELGRTLGYSSISPVNRQYGALGKKMCDMLGVETGTYLNVLLGSDLNPRAEHKLTLWKEVVEAIGVLGWASAESSSAPEAPQDDDEPDDLDSALEGGHRERLTIERSRDATLRNRKIQQALRRNGGKLQCEVQGCGFDFAEVYGPIGKDFIEVHHTRPLGARTSAEQTSLDDLVLVCANCHAMIHVGGECRQIETLIVKAVSKKKSR